jgi:glycosyltransferase involved in cell wall biosynthesis
MPKKENVIVIGPSLTVQGGISSVEKTILSNWENENIVLYHLSTHCDGNVARKSLILLRGLTLFLFQIIKRKPRIAHVHFASRASFYRKSLFVLMANLFKIKVVLHAHGAEFNKFYDIESNYSHKLYIRYILNSADDLLVLGEWWKDFYSSIYVYKTPKITYNSIAISSPSPKKDNENSNELIILSLGRLGERKGTYDLINAYESIEERFPQVSLWLVGDGEVEKVKLLLTEKSWGDKVKVLGWLAGNSLLNTFTSADIFVLPSYNEGLPMAILEAMSKSLPIVATPVGGIPDAVVNGKNGFLVAPGDINGLRDAIITLITDKELRQQMGQNSYQVVQEKFEVKVIINQLNNLYLELMDDIN